MRISDWSSDVCSSDLWIGALHPALLRALDLDTEVWVFEMDLDRIAQRELARARPLSRFPSVRRDLAVVVAENMPWAAVEASVRASLGERLNSLSLFDQYQGPGLESGTKSLAMGLIRSEEHTSELQSLMR